MSMWLLLVGVLVVEIGEVVAVLEATEQAQDLQLPLELTTR